MKCFVMALLSLFVLSAHADEPAFNYPALLSVTPITTEQAREIVHEVGSIKSKLRLRLDDIQKERQAKIQSWVTFKDQTIKDSRQRIEACNRDPQCVKSENDALTAAMKTIHEKIQEINTYYGKQISEEESDVQLKERHLRAVLLSAKNALWAQMIQSLLEEKNGQNGFVLESNLQLEGFHSEKDAVAWFRKNIYDNIFVFLSSANFYGFASFYYRVPDRQSLVYLSLTCAGDPYDIKTLREQILSSTAEIKNFFGNNREAFYQGLIKQTEASPFYAPALGSVEEKSQACAGPIRIDSVAL